MMKMTTTIKEKIYHICNVQMMLDSELAELYGVETKAFNQAVNNLDWFWFLASARMPL